MEDVTGYFAVHSQGLGHATRAVALARGLHARRPDIALLFIAGVPAIDLVIASGFDAMPLPPVPDWPSEDGVLSPVWRWYVDYARYLRVARRFLDEEADWGHSPFLLSDGEVASLSGAVRRGVPTAAVIEAFPSDFARDLPSRVAEGSYNFWFSRLARRIDLVLALGRAPRWPNVHRIGPIARPFSASRDKLREDFVFRKKTILVTAGGTAVGEFLVREAMRAFRELRLEDTSMFVVSGPRLKVSPEPGVYTYGFVPNLQDYILAADLVITTGGASTVAEANAAGTPIIAIPPRGHAEAERHARDLGFTHDDIGRLKDVIPERLASGRTPVQRPDNDRAVRLLLDFLEAAIGS